MESIISTFFGLVFPHTIEVHEESRKVYFLLYELYSARYSVKTIIDKSLFEETLRNYNNDWTIDSMTGQKSPLIVVASGLMKQQATQKSFLGTAVEEKFHLRAFSASIIPCVPLVAEKLKTMVHPSIAPVELETGVKEGYFAVNFSLNQTFEQDAEFFFSAGYKPQETDDIDDMFTDSDQDTQHEDDEEIIEDRTKKRRDYHNNENQGELDEEEEFLAGFAEASNIQRFNDYEDGGKSNRENEEQDTDDMNESEYTVSEADTITREFNNLRGPGGYNSEQDAQETEDILNTFKNLLGDENEGSSHFSEDTPFRNRSSYIHRSQKEQVTDKSTPSVFTNRKDKGKGRADPIIETAKTKRRIIQPDYEISSSDETDVPLRKRTKSGSIQPPSPSMSLASFFSLPPSTESVISITSSVSGDNESICSSKDTFSESSAASVIAGKKPRGRPKKYRPIPVDVSGLPKRKVGRPRKHSLSERSGPLDSFFQRAKLSNIDSPSSSETQK